MSAAGLGGRAAAVLTVTASPMGQTASSPSVHRELNHSDLVASETEDEEEMKSIAELQRLKESRRQGSPTVARKRADINTCLETFGIHNVVFLVLLTCLILGVLVRMVLRDVRHEIDR